jgi:signal transduction histidine kinase
MTRDAETAGVQLARIARQILAGIPPENIPIEKVPTEPVFDWRQVKRWGINPSQLPPGSRLLFRTPTAWEAYRWYIAGTIVVVAAQLLLITGLLTQRVRRQRAEQSLRAHEASLQTSYDRIRLLAGRLINAREAARASIAEDLHDDICQRLAMVSTSIDRLKNSAGDIQDADTQEFFAALARDARGTFEAVRRLSHDLHPATLRILGLVPAIRVHCTEVAKRYDVQVTFSSDAELGYVADDIAVCFFRIAQESLRNGVVHGHARRLAVSLTKAGGAIEMTVTDDGEGFNRDTANRDDVGVGVITMEERAQAVGGSLDIMTDVQRGTTIRVRAPLNSKPAVSIAHDTLR